MKWNYVPGFLWARFLRRRLPLMVIWHLTYRCNNDCAYCGISRINDQHELRTADVFSLIDELGFLGTKRIHFCGGECLLREDFPEILNYCNKKFIDTGLISNGALVPRHIRALKMLSLLKLSFDGPQDIHDRLRGEGSYAKLMDAVGAARKEGVKVAFNCTLCKENLDCVDFMLEKSRELRIPVMFSPVNYVHSVDKQIAHLIPEQDAYRRAIETITRKANGRNYVLNSTPALEYLKAYPQGKKIRACSATQICCHIKPDGSLHPCERVASETACRYHKGDIAKKFLSLRAPRECSGCWCAGVLDLNFVYNLKISSCLSALREH